MVAAIMAASNISQGGQKNTRSGTYPIPKPKESLGLAEAANKAPPKQQVESEESHEDEGYSEPLNLQMPL